MILFRTSRPVCVLLRDECVAALYFRSDLNLMPCAADAQKKNPTNCYVKKTHTHTEEKKLRIYSTVSRNEASFFIYTRKSEICHNTLSDVDVIIIFA